MWDRQLVLLSSLAAAFSPAINIQGLPGSGMCRENESVSSSVEILRRQDFSNIS